MPAVEVRRATAGDEQLVLAAAHLFDDPPDPAAVAALLASPGDHLLLASLGGQPAGFLLAHELRRLDGPHPELFLYEVATDPAFQRRGVARALIAELKETGRRVGARNIFVLTHAANRPAMALYAATGGSSAGEEATGVVMFDYDL